MSEQLWGGGKLVAPSPEASSLAPPDQEEIHRFIAESRAFLAREVEVSEDNTEQPEPQDS